MINCSTFPFDITLAGLRSNFPFHCDISQSQVTRHNNVLSLQFRSRFSVCIKSIRNLCVKSVARCVQFEYFVADLTVIFNTQHSTLKMTRYIISKRIDDSFATPTQNPRIIVRNQKCEMEWGEQGRMRMEKITGIFMLFTYKFSTAWHGTLHTGCWHANAFHLPGRLKKEKNKHTSKKQKLKADVK